MSHKYHRVLCNSRFKWLFCYIAAKLHSVWKFQLPLAFLGGRWEFFCFAAVNFFPLNHKMIENTENLNYSSSNQQNNLILHMFATEIIIFACLLFATTKLSLFFCPWNATHEGGSDITQMKKLFYVQVHFCWLKILMINI